jgi:DNA-binding NarL/FixJ family response regulator
MSKNILIVDNSFVIRAATRHFLEEETDFTVCGEAIDGLDALEKAEQLHPDLIILDLAMPRMNGLQAAVKLRAMSIRAPIILFTMHAEAMQPFDALAAGVNAVVSKSDLTSLQRHVESLLVTA